MRWAFRWPNCLTHHRKASSAELRYSRPLSVTKRQCVTKPRSLPKVRQTHSDLRMYMGMSFEALASTFLRRNEDDKAEQIVREGLEFDPQSSGLLAVRGMLHYPSSDALADFQRAITLPNAGYAAYLYLASHAFQSQRFKEAERLCDVVLTKRPGKQIRAQTTAWLAVIKDCLGAPKQEVEKLFTAAFEIDPDNAEATANYHAFKELIYDVPVLRNRLFSWPMEPKLQEPEYRTSMINRTLVAGTI